MDHDVGTATRGAESTTRPDSDPAVVRRELEVAAEGLHCTACLPGGPPVRARPTDAVTGCDGGLRS